MYVAKCQQTNWSTAIKCLWFQDSDLFRVCFCSKVEKTRIFSKPDVELTACTRMRETQDIAAPQSGAYSRRAAPRRAARHGVWLVCNGVSCTNAKRPRHSAELFFLLTHLSLGTGQSSWCKTPFHWYTRAKSQFTPERFAYFLRCLATRYSFIVDVGLLGRWRRVDLRMVSIVLEKNALLFGAGSELLVLFTHGCLIMAGSEWTRDRVDGVLCILAEGRARYQTLKQTGHIKCSTSYLQFAVKVWLLDV